MTLAGLLGAAALAVAAAAVTGPVLRRLPEPAPEPGDEPKTPYRELATRTTTVWVLLAALVAGAVAAWRSDLLLWAGPAAVGAISVVVDARTTYLPRLLAHAAAVVAVVGVVLHSTLAWDVGPVARAVAGMAAGGGLMLAAWRVLGTGFGDVRLMALLGACAAAHGWGLLYPALLLATTCGALWGVAHRLAGRRGVFPYGPGLWLGTFLALAWWG